MNSLFGANLEVIPYYSEKMSDPSIEGQLSQFEAICRSRPGHYPDYVGVVVPGEGTIEAKMALHDAIVRGQDHRSVAEGIGIKAAERGFWVFSTVASVPSAMKAHPAFVLDFCAGAVVATRKASIRGRKHRGYLDHAAIRRIWRTHLPAMWNMWRTHGDPSSPELASAFDEWLALADRYGLPQKDELATLDRDVLRQIAKLDGRCDPTTMRHVTSSVVAHYLPLLRWYQVFARNHAVRNEINRFPRYGEESIESCQPSQVSVESAAPISPTVGPSPDVETNGTASPLDSGDDVVRVPQDIDAGGKDQTEIVVSEEGDTGAGSSPLDVVPSNDVGRPTTAIEGQGRLSILLGDVVMIEMEDTGELPGARTIAEIVEGLVGGRRSVAISIRVGAGMETYGVRIGFEMVRHDRGVEVLADGASLRLRPAASADVEDFREAV